MIFNVEKENGDKCGIYEIRNLITNQKYIGSTNCFKIRFGKHRLNLRKNKHNNIYMQNSYNKYGAENFSFSIIELCDKDSNYISIEQKYLDEIFQIENHYDLYFNISKNAFLPSGTKGMKASQETRNRQSVARKGEKNGMFGKKHSEETKAKISAMKKGKKCSEKIKLLLLKYAQVKGKKISDKTKKNISNGAKKRCELRPNKFIAINIINGEKVYAKSITDLYKKIKVGRKLLTKFINENSEKVLKKQWIIAKIDEN